MSLLKEIQAEELLILEAFHDFCKKYDLTYYAVGGTLIGAVRHQGFIPWDDDIDLAMPRPDFDRFLNLTQGKLDDSITVYEDPLEYKNLKLIFQSSKIKGLKLNPFIDVFPLDGFPDGRFTHFLTRNKILFYRMLYKVSVVNTLENRDRGKLENFIFHSSSKLRLHKVLNSDKLADKLKRILVAHSYENSNLVGNILGRYREKEIVPKQYFSQVQEVNFETIKINIPKEYDAYLKNIYGDYMTLPPESERTNHGLNR